MRIAYLPLFFLGACATIPISTTQSEEKIQTAIVIEMADGSALINGSIISFAIYDGALMDTSMQPIYQRKIKVEGDTSVAYFHTLLIPKADYSKLVMPSYSVRIEQNGKLLAINKSNIPVDLNGQFQTLKIDRL